MTREEMRLKAALRLLAANDRSDWHYGSEASPYDPWPWQIKDAIKGADALLAELERGAKEETTPQQTDLAPTAGQTLDEWAHAVKMIYGAHPILAELAELRRAKAALEALEANGWTLCSTSGVWRAWWAERRIPVEAPTLLALAEKIKGENQ